MGATTKRLTAWGVALAVMAALAMSTGCAKAKDQSPTAAAAEGKAFGAKQSQMMQNMAKQKLGMKGN